MEEIREKLKEIIRQVFDVEIEPAVTPAPEGQGADYATNVAMQLAGKLKAQASGARGNAEGVEDVEAANITPRDVANKISMALASDRSFPFSVEIAGPGFLNFISRDEYFVAKLAEMRADFAKYIAQNEYAGKKVVCEFSDPNPFKVLHVGHLYTSMMGESISRLVECAGGVVVRANFGGDVGLHVAKTMYELTSERSASSADALLSRRTLSTARSATPASSHNISDESSSEYAEVLARCYVDGTRAYDDDQEARDRITKLNKEIYKIAEAGPSAAKTRLAKLYWAGRQASYDYFEEFYARIGVKFDKYYPESTVAGRGLSEVSKHIGEVYEKSDGAVIFPGEKYGLHTRVFINKEGLPTYETKDVGLLFSKWDDYKFDTSIVITGNDIIDYMKVVLKSVSMYAPELTERTRHITHGNVRLPGNEKMSSRKGNFVRAVDVLDAVSAEVSDPMIALGAIKYAFLKYKIGGNIEFDVSESVSMTGNSGVYLQYSAVRAKKILGKLPAGRSSVESFWNLNDYEKSMIRKLCEYPVVLKEAVRDLAPHKIAGYLYEAAQEFSKFYENIKVAGSEYEAQRVQVVMAYLDVMVHGLKLLGIDVPEEM